VSAALVTEVFRQSRSTGRARLVLLALAHCASHEAFERYGDQLAWPSRTTLAHMAGIPDSPKGPNVAQVHRELRRLEELGEIAWSGETKGKGAKVYEILLDVDAATPTRDTQTSRVAASHTTPRDDSASTRDDSELTRDTQMSRGGDTWVSHEPEGTGNLEQEEEQARADARGGGRESEEEDRGDRHTLDGMRRRLRSRQTTQKERNELAVEIAELETEAVR
jgi:hypothetical protein